VELERTRLAQVARALPAEIAEAQAALTAAERLARRLQPPSAAKNRSAAASIARSAPTARRLPLSRPADSLTTPAQACRRARAPLCRGRGRAPGKRGVRQPGTHRTQEAALAAARAKVESLAAALDNTRERISLRQAEVARQQATLTAEREAIRPLIETEWIMRFDRLCASRGTGLAALKISNAPVAAWASGPDVEPASRRRAAHLRQLQPPALLGPVDGPRSSATAGRQAQTQNRKPPAPED